MCQTMIFMHVHLVSPHHSIMLQRKKKYNSSGKQIRSSPFAFRTCVAQMGTKLKYSKC